MFYFVDDLFIIKVQYSAARTRGAVSIIPWNRPCCRPTYISITRDEYGGECGGTDSHGAHAHWAYRPFNSHQETQWRPLGRKLLLWPSCEFPIMVRSTSRCCMLYEPSSSNKSIVYSSGFHPVLREDIFFFRRRRNIFYFHNNYHSMLLDLFDISWFHKYLRHRNIINVEDRLSLK